ncbi:sensor histidine kinase [Azorhizobium doebereinerae]|uniref:sensor histidine kinase n=1 Tax=Azorhizobium doebereinerae TaxID=281091 RepID=UPI00048F1A82|nr:ATP-binding protein [Azorhizobium doebereinerae]
MAFRRRDLSIFLSLALILSLAAGWLGYLVMRTVGLEDLHAVAERRLAIAHATLERQIEKYGLLPNTASVSRDVIDFLTHPTTPQSVEEMSRQLKTLNGSAGTLQTFLINPEGRIVASSNWREPDSFVGRDISYRPYVQNAQPGRTTGYYAVGTTGDAPGYYLATAVESDGRRVGVVAIKLGLDQLERLWLGLSEPALMVDDNGVVVLSSVPGWKFGVLGPLPPEAASRLVQSQQYNQRALRPLDWVVQKTLPDGSAFVRAGTGADSQTYLAVTHDVPNMHMRIIVLTEPRQVYLVAWGWGVAAAMTALACALLHALNLRRISVRERLAMREALQASHDRLEILVEERSAELRTVNAGLRREVGERIQAVKQLQSFQEELIRTENLAVIGQLSAGIAHEINQPLAALSTLSANAVRFLERDDLDTVRFNLGRISELVARMGTLTGQLRSFARRSTGEIGVLPIGPRIDSAVALLSHRLTKDGVVVELLPPPAPLLVPCDAVRLEQVLVNLISNAVDASADQKVPHIQIRWQAEGEVATIAVIDNGVGLADTVKAHLFEPFFTTKKTSGLGLGLAISADIIRGFGGTLSADNNPDGGARFVITLPTATQKETACG